MAENRYLIQEFGNGSSGDQISTKFRTKQSGSENVAAEFYQNKGFQVVGLDSGVNSGSLSDDDSLPVTLKDELRGEIKKNHDLSALTEAYPLSFIGNLSGIPDFIIYSMESNDQVGTYRFIEVKTPSTGLSKNQLEIAFELNHFPYNVAYVAET